MGFFKQEQIRKEENFRNMAADKGWVCDDCGEVLQREELGLFERDGRKLCASCANALAKLEDE